MSYRTSLLPPGSQDGDDGVATGPRRAVVDVASLRVGSGAVGLRARLRGAINCVLMSTRLCSVLSHLPPLESACMQSDTTCHAAASACFPGGTKQGKGRAGIASNVRVWRRRPGRGGSVAVPAAEASRGSSGPRRRDEFTPCAVWEECKHRRGPCPCCSCTASSSRSSRACSAGRASPVGGGSPAAGVCGG